MKFLGPAADIGVPIAGNRHNTETEKPKPQGEKIHRSNG